MNMKDKGPEFMKIYIIFSYYLYTHIYINCILIVILYIYKSINCKISERKEPQFILLSVATKYPT